MKLKDYKTNTGRGSLSDLPNQGGGITANKLLWLLLIVSLAFAIMLIPDLAYAGGGVPAGPTPGKFVVKEDDYFINYLLKGMLGDVVNPNGASAGQTIKSSGTLGEIFKTFNLGVTFFGSIIVMFLAVIGIMNTGHDGEFLGKRWSSMWVPIRFAGGAALLLPVTNAGYSFVQAMCLFIASQGVGFADNVWSSILSKVTKRTSADIVIPFSASGLVSNIMGSNLCVAYYNHRTAYQNVMKYDSVDNFDKKVNMKAVSSGWGLWQSKILGFEFFGGTRGSDTMCGSFSSKWSDDPQDPMTTIRSALANAYVDEIKAINKAIVQNGIAVRYVKAVFKPADDTEVPKLGDEMRQIIKAQSEIFQTKMTEHAGKALEESGLANAAKMSETMDAMGFAVAGAFYMEMAKVQNAVRSGFATAPTYSPIDRETMAKTHGGPNFIPVMKEIMALSGLSSEEYAGTEVAAAAAAKNGTTTRTIDLNESMFSNFESKDFFATGMHHISMAIIKVVIGVGSENNGKISSSLEAVQKSKGNNNTITGTVDPKVDDNHSVIMQLKAKGDSMLNIAAIVWAGYMAVTGYVNGAEASVLGKGLDLFTGGVSAIRAVLQAMSAFMFTLVMSLITLGVTLAVMIPMIPFMLWVMGIAGLLVLIIESLVASMLWAVMLMHPSGEGITSDQSREGLMILLNLFMRPSLMLMGMVCGIFMVDPMVDFVNDMFFFVFKSTQASTYTGLFITFGFISIYCTLILSIVKRTFSLIHVIPDTVLAWISGRPHNLGMTDAADKAESIASTSGERVSQGMGSATKSMEESKQTNVSHLKQEGRKAVKAAAAAERAAAKGKA